jgi:hypothetical protein
MPASALIANEASISTFVKRLDHFSNAANSWLVPGNAVHDTHS